MQEFSSNDIANFAKKLTSTINFRGASFPISYRIDDNIEPDNWVAWANGTVTIDGKKVCVGGGWIDADRAVQDYSLEETGDFEELADLLGLSEDDAQSLDDLYTALCQSLPAEWPEKAIKV